MKNSTVKETSISTFEKVSRSLVAQWKALNNVKTSTSDKGFDTRLGRQLQICRANSSSNKQITRQSLGCLYQIDRRRRSEALWFVDTIDSDNGEALKDFMKSSKKGFTNLTSLKKAFEASLNPVSETEEVSSEETDKPETEEVSSEKEQKEIDINDKTISLTIIKLVEEKKLSIEKYGNLIEILLNDYTNRTFSKEEAAILNAIPTKGLEKAVA